MRAIGLKLFKMKRLISFDITKHPSCSSIMKKKEIVIFI